jgi:hypothetical protein
VLKEAVNASYMNLKDVQKLMGQINELAKMSPYIRFFKVTGNRLMREFSGNKELYLKMTDGLRSDIRFCAEVVATARRGLPIASRPGMPPLSVVDVFSDAAGAKFTFVNSKRVPLNEPNDRGAACMIVEGEKVSWYNTVKWPLCFINEAVDEEGKFFGSKTTTLEIVGMMLLFLGCPEKLMGQSVVFHVDNIAILYGWNNGSVKFDSTASALLKFIQLAAAYLGTQVYIKHVHRCSDEWSTMADRLSRTSSTTDKDRDQLRIADTSAEDELLRQWLQKPDVSPETPYVFLGHLTQLFRI